jgi:hypothetical protein
MSNWIHPQNHPHKYPKYVMINAHNTLQANSIINLVNIYNFVLMNSIMARVDS